MILCWHIDILLRWREKQTETAIKRKEPVTGRLDLVPGRMPVQAGDGEMPQHLTVRTIRLARNEDRAFTHREAFEPARPRRMPRLSHATRDRALYELVLLKIRLMRTRNRNLVQNKTS